MASKPSATPQGRPQASAHGYEKRDASAPWIFGIVALLAFSGIVVHLILARMLTGLQQTPTPTDAWIGGQSVRALPPARPAFPRLQLSPAIDLNEFRAREAAELEGYGWINRTNGIVRIPIGRAMDLLLQRGLPVRTDSNAPATGPSSFELQQQRPAYREPEIQRAR